MVHTLCNKIGFMRLFRRIVVSYAACLFLYRYACAPFILKFNDANKTRFVAFIGLSDVLRISVFKHFTKILKSVIVFYAVYVVYVLHRPRTCNVEPRQPMRLVDIAVDPYRYVANAFFAASSGISDMNAFSNAFAPRKQTCLRVVIKNLTKTVCGKFWHFVSCSNANTYAKTIVVGGQA